MRQLTCMPLLPVHGCSTNCDVFRSFMPNEFGPKYSNLALETGSLPHGFMIIVTDWPEISLL
uniref:Uncharacterized protein n=1 Tax=Anguilla anguilla TaxID=7936 RepID=A0A0E9RTG2_ANGAN